MKWIKAKKGKPESGKLVMIYTPEKTILESSVLMGVYWMDSNDWTVYDFNDSVKMTVTHWKEIPKPPK